MRKVYGITASIMALIMVALLAAVMAANRQSREQLKELDSFLAEYETAETETVIWVKVAGDEGINNSNSKHGSSVERNIPSDGSSDILDPVSAGETSEEKTQADILPVAEAVTEEVIEAEETTEEFYGYDYPSGDVLNPEDGINYFYGTLETYYNLPMEGVVDWMHSLGYDYEYWIREDGVKMFGPYVMAAADYGWMPKGSILETSLGLAMVCDTGEGGWYWTDIAVDW